MTKCRTLNERENFLRTVEMRKPKWIPCRVYFLQAAWSRHREELEDVVTRHPLVFGDYQRGSVDFDNFGVQYKGNLVMDEWRCVWSYNKDGMAGQVVRHPLEDYQALQSYKPPDYPLWGPPSGGGKPIQRSWYKVNESLEQARNEGRLTAGGLPHGFMFQRLYYLRSFKNLMVDFAKDEPRLENLIEMVLEQNMRLIDKWLELGPLDVLHFGDDLGTQKRLPINPETFRKYLIPAYAKMFAKVREAGTQVYLHSDGCILEIAEDLAKAGVTILNIQDKVNGIDNIAKTCKDTVCVDLDIDRQDLLPFGTPKDIESHIKDVVNKLGSKNGGLMLKGEGNFDVPLANIEALCQAMEKYQCCES